MKTNIYMVTANNGLEYDEYNHQTVVVNASSNKSAVKRGENLLKKGGYWHNAEATLIFRDVIMKKPKS
jgi:hypothetical protein